MCQKLKRFLLLSVLLLFCALPLFSQGFVLAPIATLNELQILNNSVTNKLLTTVNSLIQQQLETEKWLGISKQQETLINNLSMALQDQEKLLIQISNDYEAQLTTQEELTRSLKAQNLKTSFIVGGVCIVVGATVTAVCFIAYNVQQGTR